MLMTQYKIMLPSDYDMEIIKTRVKNNGFKTDGFTGLKFKLYLVTVKGENNNIYNSYAPLYLWNDTQGLNKFLFQGFYDNIINSFGWQKVDVNVPLFNTNEEKLSNVNYVIEADGKINEQISLKNIEDHIKEKVINIDGVNYIIAYNPTSWTYKVYYFVSEIEKIGNIQGTIYQVLHISQ